MGNKLYFSLIWLTWVVFMVLFLLVFQEAFSTLLVSIFATAFVWYGVPAAVRWICGFLPYTYHEAKVVKFVDQSDEFWWHGIFQSRRNLRRGYVVTFKLLESGKKKRFFIPFGFIRTDRPLGQGILCMQGVCFSNFSPRHGLNLKTF